MLSVLADDGPSRPAPPVSAARGMRNLRHRVVLLLLTFSVVILPNILSYGASVLGD